MLRRFGYKPQRAYPKDWSLLLTLEFPEGNSDPFARRRLCARGHNSPQPMAHRLGSEIELVVPLDLGHFQERVNEAVELCQMRKPSSQLVLSDVLSLEAPRAIHREEPSSDMAEQRDGTPNALHLSFAARIRP